MHLSIPSGYRNFERLVHLHQHRIYGLACYLLTDREAAADVTQEVFLRLWNHRDELEEERLQGWLIRVTRNACIDEMRRRRTYRSIVANDNERLDLAEGYMPGPDCAAEEADFQERLQHALGQIAEPYRSIVILREIQDMTYEDIGSALELPLNTVKVYLHRGRKMLREQLSEVIERETV